MVSQRLYEAVAAEFRDVRRDVIVAADGSEDAKFALAVLDALAEALGRVFVEDDQAFPRDKFLAAARGEDVTVTWPA